MDICSSLAGLKSILEVPQTTPVATQTESGTAASQSALSSVGSAASLTVADSGVRTDKVAEIQAALAAGTYRVPASAVASKVVDVMCESAAEFAWDPARIRRRTNATAGARGESPWGQFTPRSASHRGLWTPMSPPNIVFSNVANATVDIAQAVSDTEALNTA
jgi:anti-sigma28 factor (negative regulator of flagellin synthesis)